MGLSLTVRMADRDCVNPFRPPAATKQLGGSGEAIFTARRRRPETEIRFHDLGQTMGCDHVSVHTQFNLPRSTQDLPIRNAQAGNRLMGLWAQHRK